MSATITRRLLLAACPALLAGPAVAVAGNQPPDQPTITEPGRDGQVVNAADVHMETAPFSDPDPGDGHACTDWEIWTVAPAERIWSISCIGGVERVHAHLGDGAFEGSHDGRSDLMVDTSYLLRVRHRDDSGDRATEWSPWSERPFVTAPPTAILPLSLDDVREAPAPAWTTVTGIDVILPGGDGGPRLRIESAAGELLLEFRGTDGSANLLVNPGPLEDHVPVRVRADGGDAGAGLVLPATNVTLTDDECGRHTIMLPPLDLAAGAQALYWVSFVGGTYEASERQREPEFSSLVRGPDLPWAVLSPGFVVEVVAGGFQLPVNIAFVPDPGPAPDDPLFYVTELYGTVKVVKRDGAVGVYASGLLDFEPSGNFPGSGEQGVTGLVVEPATGDLLVSMLFDSDSQPGTHDPRVDRFTSDDGGLTAAGQCTVISMDGEPQGQSHQISNLTVGPDGMLYVHMGDGFDAGTAQDLDSFRGKILRMTPEGAAPDDNPFYDAGDGIGPRDYVFAYGVRNPFGGAWREADGFHYEVENGPSVDRLTRIEAGVNYLWDGSDASMFQHAIYNWVPAVGPVNIAFVQPGTFGGSGFPADRMDHAFVSESGPTWASGPQSHGKRISEFALDLAGGLISGPDPLIEYVGEGKATVVALAAGPDGLYFSDFYKDQDYDGPTDPGASVLRARFAEETDCNDNGTPDACDVADGASADVNGNGVPDECECPGDTDGDDLVDVEDLVNVIEQWGCPGGPGTCPADVTGDGTVDVADLVAVILAWGACRVP